MLPFAPVKVTFVELLMHGTVVTEAIYTYIPVIHPIGAGTVCLPYTRVMGEELECLLVQKRVPSRVDWIRTV